MKISKYLIDSNGWFDEGGYSQFYPIKDYPNIGFKEFKSKTKAQQAFNIQNKLSKFDLAPKVYHKICRLNFLPYNGFIFPEPSNWGYITELAEVGKEKFVKLSEVQKLVNQIYTHTGLKFWDSHWYNLGLIQRRGKTKLVCIDTGKESFEGHANAWGFNTPGPKCGYCKKYQCRCSEV